MRTATEQFLTGRKVHVEGFTHRDDLGILRLDTFLCIGPVPYEPDRMCLQDVVQRDITVDVDIARIIIFPTADEVGWDVISNTLPPHA